MGFVCGGASGGLELFEFDADFYDEFKATAAAVGLGELVKRIEAGYVERSPGGGWHLLYRCPELRGSAKLAQQPGPPDAKGRPTVEVLIETRGEGGYVVVAPTFGKVHPSGKSYKLLKGGAATIADITDAEREALWSLARTFDRMPAPAEPAPEASQATPRRDGDKLRPGDDYNTRATWHETMSGHGWTPVYTRGDTTYWRRPGKSEGWSATTNHNGSGLLWMFTSSSQFEPSKSYTKFGAYAVLNQGGNHTLAAKSLGQQGYGDAPNNKNRMVGERSGDFGRLRERSGEIEVSRSLPISPKSPNCPNNPDDDPWKGLSDSELGILVLSHVTPKVVKWLLKNRVPLGKFTMLAGEGGLGKTFLLLSWAAGISVGGPAPGDGGERYPFGDVVILSAEDDAEDTIVPRLIAMGADLKRIVILGTATLPSGRKAPITLADIDRLQEVMKRRPETRLIFVDPMPSFLGRGVDDGKNAELRTILGPLAEFAAEHSIALVGVTHFNKSASAKAAQRVMGSVAYSNAARSTWCLVEDPDTEGRRLLLPVKNNLSPERNNGLAFTITDGVVVWEPETVRTPVNEVLGGSAVGSEGGKRQRAVEFLRELLTGKEMPGDEVIAAAKARGYGKNLVWEAKPLADVRNIKGSFAGQWKWTIDVDPAVEPEKAREPDFGPPPSRNGSAPKSALKAAAGAEGRLTIASIHDDDWTKNP